MSLLFNVSQLLKEPIGATRAIEIDGDIPGLDGASVTHASGAARLVRTDRGVWVQGDVTVTEDTECSRCLIPFSHWLSFTIEEVYLPMVDVNTGARLRYEDDPEESFRIDSHHMLDLTEAVRQYGVAARPLKPLCRPDCQGLCPNCGSDLNEGPCACAPETDNRWEPLLQLLAEKPARKRGG